MGRIQFFSVTYFIRYLFRNLLCSIAGVSISCFILKYLIFFKSLCSKYAALTLTILIVTFYLNKFKTSSILYLFILEKLQSQMQWQILYSAVNGKKYQQQIHCNQSCFIKCLTILQKHILGNLYH